METEATTALFFFDLSTSADLSPSDPSSWQSWYIYIVLVYAIAILMVLVGNLLTVFVFFKFVPSSSRTASDCLICNLSASDIISTGATTAFVFFNYFQTGIDIVSTHRYACLITLSAIVLTYLSSFAAILSLSIQRLIAVMAPLRYKSQKKRPVILLGIVLPWCLIAGSISLPLFGWNSWEPHTRCTIGEVYSPAYSKYFVIFPCACILFSIPLVNAAIFIALVKHQSKVAAMYNGPSVEASNQNQLQAQMTLKSHREVSKTLFIIVGVFYACLLPWLSLFITSMVDVTIFRTYPALAIIFEISKPAIYFNGALNPIVHASRNAHFKQAFRRCFGKE